MPKQVSLLFTRLCELADAEGAVPEDGSGVDGVWTTTIPARERDRDWTIGMNADVHEGHTVSGWPGDDDETTIRPGQAVINLGRMPGAALTPHSGEFFVEQYEDGPNSIEDEVIADVEARVEALEEAADE